MGIKGIVFDLDGVIVSTDEYHYLAWKEMAEGEGIDFDRKKNNRLRGVSRMASLEIVLEGSRQDYSDARKQFLAAKKNHLYQEFLKRLTPRDLLPGVMSTLVGLRQAGYLLAIGSSSKNTMLILRRIGLENFFDAVADGNDITFSKPDPEVFLLACKKLGLKNNECAVVEDAVSGIEAAKAAGMLAIAIGDACKSPKKDQCIKRIDEIPGLIRLYD